MSGSPTTCRTNRTGPHIDGGTAERLRELENLRPHAGLRMQLNEHLTPREREVAGLLAQGRTNAEIASALYRSVAAVKKHVNAMLHKYGVKNRTQLARSLPSVRGPEGRRESASPFSSDA